MAKNKMKFDNEALDAYSFVTYTKKCEMWTAYVALRVWISPSGVPEVQDIEVDFFVEDKRLSYTGFKELYENLFGKDTYQKYTDELAKEAEVLYKERAATYEFKTVKKIQN